MMTVICSISEVVPCHLSILQVLIYSFILTLPGSSGFCFNFLGTVSVLAVVFCFVKVTCCLFKTKVWRALCFARVLFFFDAQTLFSQTAEGRPIEVYRRFDCRPNSLNLLTFCPPSPIFNSGSKSVKFCFDFQYQLHLMSSGLKVD